MHTLNLFIIRHTIPQKRHETNCSRYMIHHKLTRHCPWKQCYILLKNSSPFNKYLESCGSTHSEKMIINRMACYIPYCYYILGIEFYLVKLNSPFITVSIFTFTTFFIPILNVTFILFWFFVFYIIHSGNL